ncbi:MAG: hypothetical protein H7Y17_13495 [Chlorobia bacterium]|nr:hypothetical protein [Fimbriimonadaceae bacterium]
MSTPTFQVGVSSSQSTKMTTILATAILLSQTPSASALPAPTVPLEEARKVIRSFKAEEAQQGVAVDDQHVYVIGNSVIGKYDRKSGIRVARFEGGKDGALAHMNGGVVVDGKLYCSHSNYPETPMHSSIEIFDAKTLTHIGSQSFGLDTGSLVWVDWYQGHWWVCFGHYNEKGGEKGKTNDFSVLVKYDKDWRRVGGYAFPKELVARWDGMTCSGGVFGRDGLIYATGHHAPEVHVLRFPKAGPVLELVKIIKSPVEGQGVAIDRASGRFFQMQRKTREIVEFTWD